MPIIYTSPNGTYAVTHTGLRGYEVRAVAAGFASFDWKVIARPASEGAAIEAARQLDKAEAAGEFDAV